MRELLVSAFENTIAEIMTDLTIMPLPRWNESIFRFLYSRTIASRKQEVRQYFECNRIDLVLNSDDGQALMEFKFYGHSPRHHPVSEKKSGRKGFPSAKNLQEFEASVSKLRNVSGAPEAIKLVALFYSDPFRPTGGTYDSCYGENAGLEDRLSMDRLYSASLLQSNDSNCYARLYEVLG